MWSIKRKIVVIGDEDAGKTSLLTLMVEGRFPYRGHDAVVYGGFVKEVVVDGKKVKLSVWDPGVGRFYDNLRLTVYPGSAVIVICFAVDDIKSFRSVTERWYPEVQHFCAEPRVPILLVGCKTDLRVSQEPGDANGSIHRDSHVTSEQGRVLAEDIGAVKYIECSAKEKSGVAEVLLAATGTAAAWDPEDSSSPPKSCVIA